MSFQRTLETRAEKSVFILSGQISLFRQKLLNKNSRTKSNPGFPIGVGNDVVVGFRGGHGMTNQKSPPYQGGLSLSSTFPCLSQPQLQPGVPLSVTRGLTLQPFGRLSIIRAQYSARGLGHKKAGDESTTFEIYTKSKLWILFDFLTDKLAFFGI